MPLFGYQGPRGPGAPGAPVCELTRPSSTQSALHQDMREAAARGARTQLLADSAAPQGRRGLHAGSFLLVNLLPACAWVTGMDTTLPWLHGWPRMGNGPPRWCAARSLYLLPPASEKQRQGTARSPRQPEHGQDLVIAVRLGHQCAWQGRVAVPWWGLGGEARGASSRARRPRRQPPCRAAHGGCGVRACSTRVLLCDMYAGAARPPWLGSPARRGSPPVGETRSTPREQAGR